MYVSLSEQAHTTHDEEDSERNLLNRRKTGTFDTPNIKPFIILKSKMK